MYGNNITGNTYDGIFFYALDSSIYGNSITSNGRDGIHVEGSSLHHPLFNRIFGNKIIDNGLAGVRLVGSSYNSVTKNLITGNGDIGIGLFSSSSTNTVSRNNLTGNRYVGISLRQTGYNLVSRNNITGNIFGIELGMGATDSAENSISENNITNNNYGIIAYSSSNRIHHNNFIDNAVQVTGLSPINIWDFGYPSGGNYWSDYMRVDEKTGPGQDQPGSDGIGDTPYTVDSSNQDRYPLMLLWRPEPVETIYIRPDGSIDPPTPYLVSTDNITYTLTRSIRSSIVVERDNILVDGGGFSVQGFPGAESKGINFTLRSNVTIKNFRITGFDYGIYCGSRCLGASLYSNSITGSRFVGIIVEGYNNSIFRNEVSDNEIAGISIQGYTFTSPDGISRSSAEYNNIFQNNITDHGYAGIQLGAAWRNTAWGNNITGIGMGIDVFHSRYNVILGNSIATDSASIYFDESSSYNIIIHNVFANTPVHVCCAPVFANTWDNGYPSGGNYWSVYTGVDEKNGPRQDQPGSDGIGDTPYVIDSINQDRYPLMEPSDTIPPTTTDDYGDTWHTADFTITLTAVDYLASGLAETYYKINDGPTRTLSADGPPLINVESADTRLEYWSLDRAGNEETPHHLLTGIRLDKTPPEGSVIINGGAAYSNFYLVALDISVTDATSGIYRLRVGSDGSWTAWVPYPFFEHWDWSLPGEGTKTVYVQFMDNAGLTSQVQDTIIQDTTMPSVNAGDDRIVSEDTTVMFDSSGSTDENGISTYTWTLTDGTLITLTGSNPTYTFSNPGTYPVTLTVTDAAGNTATDTVTVTVLDTTNPVANAGQTRTVETGTTVAFDAQGSTDNAGLVSYEWDFGDGTTATGMTTTHVYPTPGTYTVTLTVRDAADNTDTHTITVTVRPRGLFATPWLGAPIAAWIIGIVVGLLTTASTAILWKKAKATPSPTHRKALEETGQTQETKDSSARVRPSVSRPRIVAGIVLTILGWTAAGYSTYLTAILLRVAILRTNVGTAIIVLAIVGVISLITLGVGWLFSGLGALLLRRKLPLLAPIVNTALFGSLFIVPQLL